MPERSSGRSVGCNGGGRGGGYKVCCTDLVESGTEDAVDLAADAAERASEGAVELRGVLI